MNKRRKGIIGMLLLVLVLLNIVSPLSVKSADVKEKDSSLNILFTTDIHSNIGGRTINDNGKGVASGGVARLATMIKKHETEENTLLLDSGDFSVGSMYQNFAADDALELRMLERLGYRAVAFGNHDFDLSSDNLEKELDTVKKHNKAMSILCSNLSTNEKKEPVANRNPLKKHGVENYKVIEKNGIRIGIFALLGYEAQEYTDAKNFTFMDVKECAQYYSDYLREKQKCDIVILLSHCGYAPDGLREDENLAEEVKGIDVILSGHTHCVLEQPVMVDGTVICGAGSSLKNLGQLKISQKDEQWQVDEYQLLPLDASVPEDKTIQKEMDRYTEKLEMEYLKAYDVEEALYAPFGESKSVFEDGDASSAAIEDYPMGKLLGDAYLHSLKEAGVENLDVAVIPVGTLRGGFYPGSFTVNDVYNVLSYGESPVDGSSGAPVCVAYLTGRELYDLCEVSVSVGPMMSAVQIMFGGLQFEYSNQRMIFDRVYNVRVGGKTVKRDDTLYKVAASVTSLEQLSLVKKMSFGLLSVMPREEDGKEIPVDEMTEKIVYADIAGKRQEIKEWYLLYRYIKSFDENPKGLYVIPDKYGKSGDYVIKNNISLMGFFKNPSKAFKIMGVALLGLILIICLMVCRIKRRKRKGDA